MFSSLFLQTVSVWETFFRTFSMPHLLVMLSTHSNFSMFWHSTSPMVTFLQTSVTLALHSSLNSVWQMTLLTVSVSVSSKTVVTSDLQFDLMVSVRNCGAVQTRASEAAITITLSMVYCWWWRLLVGGALCLRG